MSSPVRSGSLWLEPSRGVLPPSCSRNICNRSSGGGESERATDRQRAFLVELGSHVADDAGLTKRTASAWIQHHLALRSIESLRRLTLVRDDAVIKRTCWRHPETERPCETLDYAVVSSIGADGMVYFRGGNGRCGWPSSLTRAPARTRRDDYPKFRGLSDESTR